jgi:hypothetical protein
MAKNDDRAPKTVRTVSVPQEGNFSAAAAVVSLPQRLRQPVPDSAAGPGGAPDEVDGGVFRQPPLGTGD